MSVTVEGKVCINNKIDHVVSCINIETIAEPINTIISREHCVKHEILKVGQVLSGRGLFCSYQYNGTDRGELQATLCHLVNWFISLLLSSKSSAIIILYLSNKFIYSVIIKIFIQTIIYELPHGYCDPFHQ